MHTIPQGAPTNLYEAFAYMGAITQPTIDDLKLVVILEAAGKAMYDVLAAGASDPEVGRLLSDSGRDELVHAQRVSTVIATLTGCEYPVPSQAENPYLVAWEKPELTVDLLKGLIAAEYGGEALYQRWAAASDNAGVAEIFLQNGREEVEHGHRLERVAKLLAA